MSTTTQSQPSTSALRTENTHIGAAPHSRFTAVNGLELPATAAPGSGEPNSPGIEAVERHQQKPRDSPNPQGTSKQRDDWAHTNGNGSHSNITIPPQISNEYDEGSAGSSPQKRKRSSSDEQQASSATSYRSRGRPRNSPGQQLQHQNTDFDKGESDDEDQEQPQHNTATSDQQTHEPIQSNYPNLDDEGRGEAQSGGPWYGQAAQGSNPAYNNQRGRSPDSDAQLAEALQREAQGLDSHGGARSMGSHEDDDSGGTPGRQTSYGADRTPQSGVQVDHKRRKRVFSNRTKTGCMTCRRRKKKCDEQKPECNNCMRGGFVCEGYSSRNTWQKPSTNKGPIPLQSKDGYLDSSGQYPHNSLQGSHGQARGGEQSPPMYGKLQPGHIQTQAGDGAHVRPIVVDDEGDHPQTATSPQGSNSRAAWSKPAWPNTGTDSYLTEHLPKTDFSRVPPMRDLPGVSQQAAPTSATAAGSSHRSLVHHNDSAQTPQSTPSQVAQMALNHGASLRAVRAPGKTEKEKMIGAELYHPFDQQLINERELCKAACWRFNNSTNPTLGISREEREHLFRKILSPQNFSSAASPSPIGSVGDRVVVEAPFTCDYGYNIRIGDDVCIGANCTIMDTCSITVGPRCIIGPNVNIFGATLPIDPRRRNGSQGPALGKHITIEEDCWIGGGAIILPGIRIGKSSTVGAGSVVTRDVPRFTVVAGNPARVHRGIYQNETL
ncbi:MAG: Maltose acetyltransferase [Candelina mexicana]|nr:MAG: Maltose acetyltransferase [Candelina mexicana]